MRQAALLVALALAGCAAPVGVAPPGVAAIALAGFAVPAAVDVNASFEVNVTLANAGNATGDANVSVSWNGTILANATASVPAGGLREIRLAVKLDDPGDGTLVASLAGSNGTREATTHVRAPDFDRAAFAAEPGPQCGKGVYALDTRNTGDGVARAFVAHVTLFAESGDFEQDIDTPPQDVPPNGTAHFEGPIGVAEGCSAPHAHRVLITLQADGVPNRRFGATATI